MKISLKNSYFQFVCIIVAVLFFLNSSAIAQFISTDTMPLDPLAFSLPASAKEVVSRRTAKAATFRLADGKFAAVSNAQEIFTKDEKGKYVPISNVCQFKGDRLVFNRLPREARVSFDLNKPAYTYTQRGYSFTLKFNVAGVAKAALQGNDTVSYALSDKVVLRWRVEHGFVLKEVEVSKPGPLADELTFTIEKLKNLKLRFLDGLIYLDDAITGENKYVMKEPFLMDMSRNKLDRPVKLVQAGNTFTYQYDVKGLTLPYILDPSVGPNNPGTVVNNTAAGSVAWTNPGNAIGSDGLYAVASGSNCPISNYLDVTNFGFSVPAGSSIDGIIIGIDRKATGTVMNTPTLRIIKSGVVSGDNKASVSVWSGTQGVVNYGSSSDSWNAGVTVADINTSTTGFRLQVYLGWACL
jgi:hypothetical protein